MVIAVAGRTQRNLTRGGPPGGEGRLRRKGCDTADGAGWEAFRFNPWHERTIGCFHGGIPHPRGAKAPQESGIGSRRVRLERVYCDLRH